MNLVHREMQQAIEIALRAMTMSVIIGTRDGDLPPDEAARVIDILHVWASDALDVVDSFFTLTPEDLNDVRAANPSVDRIYRNAMHLNAKRTGTRKHRPGANGDT